MWEPAILEMHLYTKLCPDKNFTEPLNLDIVGRPSSRISCVGERTLKWNQETRAAVHSCAEWALHSFRDTTYRERCSLELCRALVPPETMGLLRGMGLGIVAHLGNLSSGLPRILVSESASPAPA